MALTIPCLRANHDQHRHGCAFPSLPPSPRITNTFRGRLCNYHPAKAPSLTAYATPSPCFAAWLVPDQAIIRSPPPPQASADRGPNDDGDGDVGPIDKIKSGLPRCGPSNHLDAVETDCRVKKLRGMQRRFVLEINEGRTLQGICWTVAA